MFSKQFWATAAPFERNSPSRFPVFTKYIPAFYGALSLWKICRSYSFVLICGWFRKHRTLPPLRSEKLLQYFFWHFVDARPIVRPRLPVHFADTLNSQLRRSPRCGLTLILLFPKAWFLLQIRRSNFPYLWPSASCSYCIQCVQNSKYSGGTESIWDLFAGQLVNACSIGESLFTVFASLS